MVLGRMGVEAKAIRIAEGWAWTLAPLNPSYSDMDAFGYTPITLHEPTKKEAAVIKKLGTHKAKIEHDTGSMGEWGEEESEAYATLSDEWNKIEGELSDLSDQMQVVTDKSPADVIALFQHNIAKILCGTIEPEDRKAIAKIECATTRAASGDGGGTDAAPTLTFLEKFTRIPIIRRTTAL